VLRCPALHLLCTCAALCLALHLVAWPSNLFFYLAFQAISRKYVAWRRCPPHLHVADSHFAFCSLAGQAECAPHLGPFGHSCRTECRSRLWRPGPVISLGPQQLASISPLLSESRDVPHCPILWVIFFLGTLARRPISWRAVLHLTAGSDTSSAQRTARGGLGPEVQPVFPWVYLGLLPRTQPWVSATAVLPILQLRGFYAAFTSISCFRYAF
jgi:hypothetical protein